jgi:hypothetical protein
MAGPGAQAVTGEAVFSYGTTDFGTSVAVDGDTAVAGSPLSVYSRSEEGWALQAQIPHVYHGAPVAISADTIVVGAAWETHSGTGAAGAAYVYVRTGAEWALEARLTASDFAASDRFGH